MGRWPGAVLPVGQAGAVEGHEDPRHQLRHARPQRPVVAAGVEQHGEQGGDSLGAGDQRHHRQVVRPAHQGAWCSGSGQLVDIMTHLALL